MISGCQRLLLILLVTCMASSNGGAEISDFQDNWTYVGEDVVSGYDRVCMCGEDACDLRMTIDEGFGDGNGVVTSEEVQNFSIRATGEECVKDQRILLNGNGGNSKIVEIILEGAEGPTNSTDPFAIYTYIEFDFDLNPERENELSFTFVSDSEEDRTSDFAFEVPRGWRVDSVKGLRNHTVEERFVEGEAHLNEEVTVRFSKDDGADMIIMYLLGGACLLLAVLMTTYLVIAFKKRKASHHNLLYHPSKYP